MQVQQPPTHPHPALILQCTCSQCLCGELLTGLKQIDCQHSSQGPSIRLSLSAAHTPEAMKHFALSLPHTFSPSLSIQRNSPFTFRSSVSFFLSLWLFFPVSFFLSGNEVFSTSPSVYDINEQICNGIAEEFVQPAKCDYHGLNQGTAELYLSASRWSVQMVPFVQCMIETDDSVHAAS